jgi:Cu(I)/Ag(I) efflux system membrane fusion protein
MKKKLLLIVLSTLIAAPLVGYSKGNTSTPDSAQTTTEKKPLYWVDTMEPDIHYKAPGKSRMGMDLIPVYPKDQKNTGKSSSKKPSTQE